MLCGEACLEYCYVDEECTAIRAHLYSTLFNLQYIYRDKCMPLTVHIQDILSLVYAHAAFIQGYSQKSTETFKKAGS